MLKNCAVDFDFNDYYDHFDIGGEIPEEFLMGLFSGLMAVLFVFLALAVIFYVFTSVGMHTMAKRRGIRHGWLAWLPFGASWILGSISDQYQYVAKGRIRNRRKVLLGLEITIAVLSALVSASETIFYGSGMVGALDITLTLALVAMVVSLVQMVISIVFLVFQYIALYDLFNSSDPDNAVTLLVLSIFFGFLQPFFIFASRKKELGMPPRKPVAPVPNTWQPPVEAVPAWQPPVTTAEPVAEEPAPEEQTEE